ncbi:hypothetical protein DFA_05740 [Cavenderia fasciculata]|uniref:Kinetochore protein Spc24 n=1 Tax=Cavenderia fasciculata TaxID=261658 RepID=F4PMA6_CACFS|nr:uncharacterized protein DFA_05740 [Cavenderia fasciculata]EGG23606.1 hypothetical protein DFA_05740 [Cavenderia fasciculata]|eukprot:XP_004361457.1 hypothetical protein DFA_05740 [Cavenderia fasciculata]
MEVDTEDLLLVVDEVKTSFLNNLEIPNVTTAQSMHNDITALFNAQQSQLDIVVKDMTQRLIGFEKEMKREDSDEVHTKKLNHYQEQKRSIQINIDKLEHDIIEMKKSLALTKQDIQQLREKEIQLEKQKNQLIPYKRELFTLYLCISLIKWNISNSTGKESNDDSQKDDDIEMKDNSNNNNNNNNNNSNIISGIISKPDKEKMVHFQLDYDSNSHFENVNHLWSLLE